MRNYSLFLIFLYHRFPSISCLDCFSCHNVDESSLCNTSVTCRPNQVLQYVQNVFVFWITSMAVTPWDVWTVRTSAVSLVGRNVDIPWASIRSGGHVFDGEAPLYKRQTLKCHECCSRDGCNRDLCQHLKLDGQWAQWAAWSGCDTTCNIGTEVRTRTCTNPVPANGGLDCVGNNTETKVCHKQPCPVHGGWSDWSPWGSCSATCDIGLERRDRSCSNPWPSLEGDHCFGDSHEDRICFTTPCADGGWTGWSCWGICTKTCGTGTRSRLRACTNPRPSITGRNCDGVPLEVDICKKQTCSDQLIAFNARNASQTNPPVFTNVLSNYGGGYSSTTGIFTCPLAGIYYFASTITKHWVTTTDYIQCQIFVNSVEMAGTYVDPKDTKDDNDGYLLTLSGTFHLDKNDVVQIKCPHGYSALYPPWSSFTGFLVTAD